MVTGGHLYPSLIFERMAIRLTLEWNPLGHACCKYGTQVTSTPAYCSLNISCYVFFVRVNMATLGDCTNKKVFEEIE